MSHHGGHLILAKYTNADIYPLIWDLTDTPIFGRETSQRRTDPNTVY